MKPNKDSTQLKHYYFWIRIGGFIKGLQSLFLAAVIIVIFVVVLGIVGLPSILAILADIMVAVIAVLACILFSIGQAEKAVHDARRQNGEEVIVEVFHEQRKDKETKSRKQTTKYR